MKVLSTSDLNLFHDQGFLIIRGLLQKKIALRIQEEIWDELNYEFGIKKDDPSTWKTPLHSPRKAKNSLSNDLLINDDFRNIINDILGKDNWHVPSSWGGFLVTFPSDKKNPWTLNDKLWHWDYELFRNPELGGLLIFSFYSTVPPKGGGTLVIKGSHRLLRKWKESMTADQINRKHGVHRRVIMQSHPYLKKLTSTPGEIADHVAYFMDKESIIDGIPLQVVELTGEPGDVVFCHPRLIHAPAEINCNNFPRIMRSKFLW